MPDASVPGVPAGGTAIEVVGAVVVFPEGEVPCAVTTPDGTIEVVGCAVEAVLPVEENVAEVSVAVIPVVVEGVGCADVHQVFKVDLINLVILLRCEVELIGHLVSKIVSVFLSLAETHAKRGEESRDGDEEGENKTLHND